MKDIINIRKTSNRTAEVNEILLRDKNNAKIFFKPMLVENPKNADETVKGKFIYIKDNVNRTDDILLSPGKLKKSEWMELELKTEEIMMLYNYLTTLYQVESIDNGTFIRLDTSSEKFINFFENNKQVFNEILTEKQTIDLILNSKEVLIAFAKHGDFLNKIIDLEESNIPEIGPKVQLKTLKNVRNLISENMDNNKEEFWQSEIFTKYNWVLSQLFSKPIILFQDKAFLGGKSIDSKEGTIIDYIYKNSLSGNVMLFEIKTPLTELMVEKEYRSGVHSISYELSGSLSKTLTYKDTLQKSYFQQSHNSEDAFNVFNPKALIIAGQLNKLSDTQKKSFELYRRELKDIEIITYDEILEKINNLINVMVL